LNNWLGFLFNGIGGPEGGGVEQENRIKVNLI